MSLQNVQLHLVDSVETAGNLMRWLSTTDDRIFVDIESSGLDKYHDVIRLVQVGDARNGWTIPWDQWNGVFREIVNKYEGRYGFHNAPFDLAFLGRYSVEVPRHRVDDSRILSHVDYPVRSHRLKDLASTLVDARAASMQSQLDEAIGPGKRWTWATVPLDFQPYWLYSALDTVLTAHVWDILETKVKAVDAWAAYELEIAAQWAVERIMSNGVHIDRDQAASNANKLDVYCTEVANWCKEKYGISPGSAQGVIDILIAEGYEFTKLTDGGAFALDKEVLSGIDHELAYAVLTRRQMQKLSSTYLAHFADAPDNGIIRPSINPLGARTSRMSISNPNLQNLPRTSESTAGNVVRSCVTTRYPGGSLVFCDFSQIEMRVLTHLSNDAGLQEAFRGEEDFFVSMARQVYHDASIHRKHPLRQRVKNVMYGKIYGAGTAKLAATAGVPLEDMEMTMRLIDQAFPGVRGYQETIQRVAWQREQADGHSWVRSPLTGRRHPADSGKSYTLGNYLIQGMAAEAFKMKVLALDAAGLDKYMMLLVHDEVICDVPPEDVHHVATTMRDIMNDDKLLAVPVQADVSYGPHWGAKKDYVFS